MDCLKRVYSPLARTCWSDMASDLLEYITKFLSLPDHHRFSAVCKNWRSVAKQKRQSPAPQLPWLVLGEESVTRKRIFYSLSEEKHYKIDIPELYGRYMCGSSHGWLLAIDIKMTGILINPFTREFYELPPFPPYCDLEDYSNSTSEEFMPKKMQYKLITKVILSHDPKVRPDFTVMIVVGPTNRPAFWKLGNSSWLEINCSGHPMEDVIYFKGQFYFLTRENKIFALNFEPDLKFTQVGHVVRLGFIVAQHYLVDYFGYLLLVERFSRPSEKYYLRTYWFNVFKHDFEKGVYLMSGVGDYALFLGRNSPILVDPSHFPGSGCKSNSIYFTMVHRPCSPDTVGCDDLGIFNTGDKKVTTFYPPEIFLPHVDSPLWFTPNTW